MKKKILILISIVTIISLMFMVGCTNKDFNVQKTDQIDVSALANEYIELLATAYPDRTSGTGREDSVMKFISSQMQTYGYEPNGSYELNNSIIQGANRYTYYNGINDLEGAGYGFNLIFDKKAEGKSKGTIILSTQYDNLYSFPKVPTKADGTYESGASTAMLLTISSLLKENTFPFDLKIIYYGGGSYNWEGARAYLSTMTQPEIDNILLSIDLGQIIYGDANYVYTVDKSTSYGNLINEIIEVNQLNFDKVPSYKRVANAKLIEEGLYNYFHAGMLSNNIFMLNRGIPTLNIMTHNASDISNPLKTEAKGRENFYQTGADNLENLKTLYSQEIVNSRINSIANLVVDMLTGENQAKMVSALSTAREELPSKMAQSDMTGMILGIALKMVLIIALIVTMIQMRKIVTNKQDYYKQMLNKPIQNVNQKPIDVFGWDSENKKDVNSEDGEIIEGEIIEPDDKDDNDDIFSDL